MTPITILIDERRALAAKVAGKEVEIAMALGDRAGADRARREMEAQTSARRAVVESGCYFDSAGEADRVAMQGRAA